MVDLRSIGWAQLPETDGRKTLLRLLHIWIRICSDHAKERSIHTFNLRFKFPNTLQQAKSQIHGTTCYIKIHPYTECSTYESLLGQTFNACIICMYGSTFAWANNDKICMNFTNVKVKTDQSYRSWF